MLELYGEAKHGQAYMPFMAASHFRSPPTRTTGVVLCITKRGQDQYARSQGFPGALLASHPLKARVRAGWEAVVSRVGRV